LLFSLSPANDPYGVLLRIDYYALRAREYSYLKAFVSKGPKEVYCDESNTHITFLVLPNLLLSLGLCLFEERGGFNEVRKDNA